MAFLVPQSPAKTITLLPASTARKLPGREPPREQKKGKHSGLKGNGQWVKMGTPTDWERDRNGNNGLLGRVGR